MNLELHAVKESLAEITKELQELRALVKTSSYASSFVIQYDVEYIEPLQVEKLLGDMGEVFPIHEAYTILFQESDKTYENPLLNIFKYTIHLTLFLRCTKKVYLHDMDTFFETKLGTAQIESYVSSSEFQRVLESARSKLDGYYSVEHGIITRKPLVT